MPHLTVVSRQQTLNNARVIDPLVGARIVQLRHRKGWRLKDLAAKAGVAPNTVAGLEHGKQTRWPKFEKIAAALGVTTQALQTGEGLSDENPLAKTLRLTDEALRIGKRFQDAETEIRLVIVRLLQGHRDPSLILWDRIERLSARRKETLLLSLAEHERLQAEETAAHKRKARKP